ncbi:MAG: ACP S-malonyltransferase [Victivallaceae bacterium]
MKAFFAFSGQGAQAVGMGKDLCEANSAAAEIFAIADSTLNWSVSDICFNGPEEKLTESRFCQPAIYTMSCAALAAFKHKCPSVHPVGCAGLSLGEYAAMFAAGVFSFKDGLKLVARRAELMDAACRDSNGGMASVLGGDKDVITEVCKTCDIDVANFNSPGQIVISGQKDKVESAINMLKEKGIRKIIPLKVAGAFHSRLMAQAGEQLKPVLDGTQMHNPAIPVFQNFTGEPGLVIGQIKNNLVSQVAGSVRWEECVRNMIAAGGNTMIEFGPGNVLAGLLKRTDSNVAAFNINNAEGLNALSFKLNNQNKQEGLVCAVKEV